MGGRFKFRLEVVRRIRKEAQDAQRRVVGEAIRSLQDTQGRIARLGEQLEGATQDARDVQSGRFLNMAWLRSHHLHQGYMRRHVVSAQAELNGRRTRLDEERAKLAEVTKRLKAIEKLRERRKTQHDAGLRRREQADLDEAALQTHRIRRGGVLDEGGVP